MDLLLTRARATALADAAFAATALHVAWRAAQSGSARPPPVIVSVVLLHVLMAGLLLRRRPECGAGGVLTWLPAFRGFRSVMRDERGEHPLRGRV